MSGPGDLVRRSDLIAFGNVMEASGFDAFANRIRQIAQELPAAPVDYAALPEVQALIADALEQAASIIEDNVRHAKDLGREIWPIPDLRALTPADAICKRGEGQP